MTEDRQPIETEAERYLREALSALKAAIRPLLDTSDYSQYPDIRKAFNDGAELAGKALDSRRERLKPAADAGEVRERIARVEGQDAQIAMGMIMDAPDLNAAKAIAGSFLEGRS